MILSYCLIFFQIYWDIEEISMRLLQKYAYLKIFLKLFKK